MTSSLLVEWSVTKFTVFCFKLTLKEGKLPKVCQKTKMRQFQNRFAAESNNSNRYINKTVCYHRRIFCPPILFKMPFERKETFFFQKFFIYLLIFPNFIIFYFFQKKSQLRWKRLFKEITSVHMLFSPNLPPYRFQKNSSFSFKNKTSIFSKYPNFVSIGEISSSVTFLLRQICYNLVIKNSQSGLSTGQLASKRKKTHWFEWMIFFPNMGGK